MSSSSRNACDPGRPRDQRLAFAVAELISERRGGGRVAVVSVPEDEDRTNPAVELVTADSVGELAIEHTLIEAFTGQITDQHQIQPYAAKLPGLIGPEDLPTGSRFELNVDIRAVHGLGAPKLATLKAIAGWVREAAPNLVDGRPGVRGAHMARTGPPDLPFEVTLVRWGHDPDSTIPNLTVGWWKPDDLEDQRIARIRTALAKKLPKLATAAAIGQETVLVLESDDVQISNAIDIRLALHAATDELAVDLPAWIVLWETIAETAFVWFLRTSGTWESDARPTVVPGY